MVMSIFKHLDAKSKDIQKIGEESVRRAHKAGVSAFVSDKRSPSDIIEIKPDGTRVTVADHSCKDAAE
jgi:hypothetical protein